MKLINLTPHSIRIEMEQNTNTIEPSGAIARVSVKSVFAGVIPGTSIPVRRNEYGPVENLPSPEPEKIYIVSAMVLSQCINRKDVFGPDTGPSAIRNDQGQIVAVTALISAPTE